MNLNLTEIITILIAVGGAATAGYSAWANRDATASSAWRDMLGPLRKELEALHTQSDRQDVEIKNLQTDNARLTRLQSEHEFGIRRLAAQVVSLGGQPVYSLPGAKP